MVIQMVEGKGKMQWSRNELDARSPCEAIGLCGYFCRVCCVQAFKSLLTSNGARATTHLLCLIKVNSLRWRTNFDPGEKKKNLDHFSICVRHPCAGAMLIFSVLFQFYRMSPNRSFSGRAGTYEDIAGFIIFRCGTTQKENNMELQYLSWGPTTCR